MTKLRELRMKKGLTQAQAAIIFGLSQAAYGRYELGTREPSVEMLYAMADFFGVSVDELTGREATVVSATGKPPTQLSNEEKILVEVYRSAPNDVKAAVMTLLSRR